MTNIREKFGPVIYEDYKFCWGGQSNLYWLPKWAQKLIVHTWNPIACSIWGHSYLGRRSPGELPICCDCTRYVKKFKESEVSNEW